MKYQSALALPIAAACLVLLGPNVAAARSAAKTTNTQTMNATAGRHEALQMVPARAKLTSALDARNLRAGQSFHAKLSNRVDLKNGPVLPRGTELVGKVVKDQMSGNPSILTLRFTQAHMKDGKTVPIKATIVGISAGSGGAGSSYMQAEAPNYWTPSTLQVDQINALNHVDLHSRIAANNSGVFQTKKSNIRFGPGTELALAIAKRS